jgi:hypothetical protein
MEPYKSNFHTTINILYIKFTDNSLTTCMSGGPAPRVLFQNLRRERAGPLCDICSPQNHHKLINAAMYNTVTVLAGSRLELLHHPPAVNGGVLQPADGLAAPGHQPHHTCTPISCLFNIQHM